jgi:hypothetical protein
MGFGSYDESEQENHNADVEESTALNVHENDHDGEESLEMGAEQDELLDRLQDMKDEE